jgi:phospholipid/cholesterol/gamma-HCH transport system substrate-binding protein
MKKSRNIRRMTVLGGFVLLCLAGLVVATFTLSNLSFEEQTEWTVFFGEESLVKEGYEVLVSGTKAGTVKTVTLVPDHELAPDRYVKVVLSLKEGVKLWEGAEVVVSTQGLLGRPLVRLYRGEPRGKLLDPAQPLPGRIDAGLFDALDQVVAENRGDLREFADNLVQLSRDLRGGKGTLGRLLVDETVYENFVRITDSVAGIAESVEQPDSSLGRLLRDPELYETLRAVSQDIQAITAGLRAGKGTAGRLLNDDALANELENAVVAARRLVERVERGEGSLGLLLTDTQLHDDMVAGVQALRRFAERIDKGEGTLSKLIAEDDVYENLRIFTETLKVVAEDVRAGKGSLGRLINDDTLIRELEITLRSFREGADVARENAPLSSLVSFTSLFFNVLN